MAGRSEVPDLETYYDAWSAVHGGYDPRSAFWPRTWLAMVHVLARPLVRRRVPPDVVTLLGVAATALALPPAAAGSAWPLLAVIVVVASGLLDNLDGCVAVLTGRSSRWGYVVDSLADRVCDGFYLVALWLAGAPAGLCAGAGAGIVLLEYGRARSAGAGFDEIGVVTLGERPTRIVVTCFGLAGAGIVPSAAAWSAGAGAAATLGVSLIGAAQFLRVARRALLQPSRGSQSARQAEPMSDATARADNATSGSPPPGCAEPPARNSPGTGERFAGRRNAARAPFPDDP
jgi:CDP-diacylglycerol--glycerol-3-phosphate 3-phosphatidyltransferase